MCDCNDQINKRYRYFDIHPRHGKSIYDVREDKMSEHLDSLIESGVSIEEIKITEEIHFHKVWRWEESK